MNLAVRILGSLAIAFVLCGCEKPAPPKPAAPPKAPEAEKAKAEPAEPGKVKPQ